MSRTSLATTAAVCVLSGALTHCPAGQSAAVLARIDALTGRVEPRIRGLLQRAGLAFPPTEVFLQVYKFESLVEVWAHNDASAPFTLVTTYPAFNLPKNYRAESSFDDPDAGPKLRQGDTRVPEGIYHVLYHNPWSSFHLSLALNYPNPADGIRARLNGIVTPAGERAIRRWWTLHQRSVRTAGIAGVPSVWSDPDAIEAGNEIFVHGKNVSIGCIPVGDRAIEELFVLTDHRRVGGTQVHIHPFRYHDPVTTAMRRRHEASHPWLRQFWHGLEAVHEAFRRTRRLPTVYVDEATGLYHLHPGTGRFPY